MKKLFVCLMFLLGSFAAFSQDDPDFPTVPLDGGISLLLAAGALYTTRRVIKNKNKKQEANSDK